MRGMTRDATASAPPAGPEISGAETGGAQVSRVGYAPITRVDAARREIELCATSEALDAHGTIFDYQASKDAFTRWIGNVREMHERRAVGKRVEARCDDETRRVFVRVRISRGAQDTWEKVLDGTLRGASIGASNVVWRRERRTLGGRMRAVSVATRYDLAELSLVDSPSNPDALGVTIVRDAEPDAELLDILAGDAATPERASDGEGASMAGDGGQPDLAPPAASEALHAAARAALTGCGCALCELALAALSAGDDSTDADEKDEEGTEEPRHMRQPAAARVTAAALRASARELARLDGALRALLAQRETQRDSAIPNHGATGGASAEAEVAALRARIERLEAQPLPGGPAARAVEKTLAAAPFDGYGALAAGAESLSALEALAGRLRDPQAQMAVAAEIIRLQQG